MKYLKLFENFEENFRQRYGFHYKKRTRKNPYVYIIKTYNGEDLVDQEEIYLDKPDLTTYDEDVPLTLGGNQELVFID